jgi:hypothetical protein
VVEDDVHFAISKEIFGERNKGILMQMPLHFIYYYYYFFVVILEIYLAPTN